MPKKKTKSKKKNYRKKIIKKNSTESPDNQDADIPCLDITVDEANSFVAENADVLNKALDYFKGEINRKIFANLAASLKLNIFLVPEILRSKIDNTDQQISCLRQYENLICSFMRQNKIIAPVNYCVCYQAFVLTFEMNKLIYEMHCDHSVEALLDPATIKENMRQAYRRKYYFLKRGLKVPDYLEKLTTNADYVEFLSPMRQLSIRDKKVNSEKYMLGQLTVLEKWNRIKKYHEAFTKLNDKCKFVRSEISNVIGFDLPIEVWFTKYQ